MVDAPPEDLRDRFIDQIKIAVDRIAAGDYGDLDDLYQYTNTEDNPKNVAEAAEALGLLAVKLEVLGTIKAAIDRITQGRYGEADDLFQYTNTERYPRSITDMAETVGLMAVKLEAREFKLEQTIEELKRKNAELERSIRSREEFSVIFINVVMLISGYTFLILLLNDFIAVPAYVARGLELVSVALAAVWIRRSRLPLRDFGLTFTGWRRALIEAGAATVAMVAVLVGVKLVLQRNGIMDPAESLFSMKYYHWNLYVYLLVAALQEFLARGVVQGSIGRVMAGARGRMWAEGLAPILFGRFHLQ